MLPRLRARSGRSTATPELTPAAGPVPAESWGTVVLPFGGHFAGRVDLLTRDRFKAIEPIRDVSPFSAVGEPDDRMRRFLEGDRFSAGEGAAGSPGSRANGAKEAFLESRRIRGRVAADVLKDLGARLKDSGADYLVVDNGAALRRLRDVDGRLYTEVDAESTDLMDHLRGTPAEALREPARDGLDERLEAAYDAFVDACLEAFDPTRIILVRSHIPRFWTAADGTLGPTRADQRAVRLLQRLDERFIERARCRVSHVPLRFFARTPSWHSFEDALRVAIEDDLVSLCTRGVPADGGADTPADVFGGGRAAARILRALGRDEPFDADWLRTYFRRGGASYDDLLALAYLQQESEKHGDLVRECVAHAVHDGRSLPAIETKQRFDRSVAALSAWPGCAVDLPAGTPTPHIAVEGTRGVVYRFFADGSIRTLTREPIVDVEAVVDGRTPITPLGVCEVLRSWPFYLERARRGITEPPEVVVGDVAELVDSCHWLDWARVLRHEGVLVSARGRRRAAGRGLRATTDLSFLFDPRTRIAGVSGGLMDQLTFIGHFLSMCENADVEPYFDDLRYLFTPTHDGWVASRLAPDLERRRISRRISVPLAESFRDEALRTNRFWTWTNVFAWFGLGLRELAVYTNERQLESLLAERPHFPLVVYRFTAIQKDLLTRPTPGVGIYAGQDKLGAFGLGSAEPLRAVFDFARLPVEEMNEPTRALRERLLAAPSVAMHVRRGDFLTAEHPEWHSDTSHYRRGLELVAAELMTDRPLNVVVFSDDPAFVRAHPEEFGLDLAARYDIVDWNRHFHSIYDAYLMSLCPIVIGSVGGFAGTTALLSEQTRTFVRTTAEETEVVWSR